jgi:hypothetical protein
VIHKKISGKLGSLPGISSGGGSISGSSSAESRTGAVTTGGITFGAKTSSKVEMMRWGVILVVALFAIKTFKG